MFMSIWSLKMSPNSKSYLGFLDGFLYVVWLEDVLPDPLHFRR